MNKVCIGCGAILQDEDINEVGYTTNLENDLCRRCFRLKHYGEYKEVTKSNTEFMEILRSIGGKKALVLLVVDLVSVPKNINNIVEYLGDNRVILVLNKKDMLPLSTTDKKILDYFSSEYEDLFTDKIVVSAEKSHNLDELYKMILKYKGDNDVYIVGNTNAGKSSLINKFISNYSVGASDITISSMPSTTLDEIKIPFKDFYLIDTPGLVDKHSIVNYISEENIKKLSSHKEIKPRTYQIKEGHALIIENFLRVDYEEGDKNSFTVFVSNEIDIKRINGKKHDDLKDLSRKELELKYHEDIVINGLGFIKTVMEGKVYIYVDKDVEVFTRKNMI